MSITNVFESPAAHYPSEAVHRYYTEILPLFAVMLAVTGLTTLVMIRYGFVSIVAGFGLVGYLALLVVQVGVFKGARSTRSYYPANAGFALFLAVFEGIFISPIIAGFLTAGLASLIGQALILSAVVFIGLTVFSFVTERDFSFLAGILFPVVLGLIVIGIVSFFVGFPGWFAVLINVVSIVVFSLLILSNMSNILRHDRGPVAGAMSLYIAFMVIFLNMASLLRRTSQR